MAVVFISPKQKQKIFLMGIAGIFLLFMAFVMISVFTAGPAAQPAKVTYNKAKINLNFTVLDSSEFKKLEAYQDIESQYTYTVRDSRGKQTSGTISAISIADARSDLEGMGYEILKLNEVEVGRDNPFYPYYQKTTK